MGKDLDILVSKDGENTLLFVSPALNIPSEKGGTKTDLRANLGSGLDIMTDFVPAP